MNPLLCQLSYAAVCLPEDNNRTGVDKVSSNAATGATGEKDSGRLRAEAPAEGRVCVVFGRLATPSMRRTGGGAITKGMPPEKWRFGVANPCDVLPNCAEALDRARNRSILSGRR